MLLPENYSRFFFRKLYVGFHFKPFQVARMHFLSSPRMELASHYVQLNWVIVFLRVCLCVSVIGWGFNAEFSQT